ncbi:trypsin-like serine peptidase [Streptomyces natalensis]|uniref:trypsin-like serine peptidase n=1 Tax=Streptomyces natalensis TaxID=68242 RepID=UPI000B06EC3D|nr:serine protease [Streptomyces natalensis]
METGEYGRTATEEPPRRMTEAEDGPGGGAPPADAGRYPQRRVVLALLAAGLLAGGAALVLWAGARDPYLADGDPDTGTYRPGRHAGDAAAAALLAGPYRERPGPLVPVSADRGGSPAPLPASRPLQAAPAAPSPPVGALFSPGDDGDPGHHCTASVVHSPAGDLVVTAAHCVHDGGFRTRLVFVPGLRDGIAPYGLWVPTRIDVDPRWIADRDPDRDLAFLRVRRAGRPADGRTVEEVTGAEQIRFGAPVGRPALLTGYPEDRDTPLACRHTADAESGTQLRFDCPGFPNGTSGGPMLIDVDPATGTGSLIGVIGGLDEGGDDATSYSSRLGKDLATLYRRATS